MADLKGKDILDGAQFTVDELELIMGLAADFGERLAKGERLNLAQGRIMGCLFFEPSTRTRLSFETAMYRLNGEVVGFAAAGTTSTVKGESLADTIRTVDQYVDIIVMRHPQIGSAKEAAVVAHSPIINGGDGAGQHPTQALLDLYSIQSELGGLNGGTIVLCGDLKNGRTIHAGVELYKHFPFKLVFVAPDPLRMPDEITAKLRAEGLEIIEETDLEKALSGADVLYMTRIQKERFADPSEYERLKGSYVLTREIVERINPDLAIFHPLPRVDEIATNVDTLAGAAYFRQVRNGVAVRMALISLVLGLD